MNKEIIARATAYVKEKFENEYSGHDWFHTLRVFRTATRIAEAEGADLETVQLAALLHDVDDRKLSPETYAEQKNARSFLAENGVEQCVICEICRIISEVSFVGSDSVVPSTLEGKCVQDADRLDAIGAIGIARAFAYGGNHNRLMYHPDIAPKLNMSREEYIKSNSTTVNHFYEKLFKLTDMMNTDTAKQIAKERDAYMKAFIAEFLNEWEGRK
ncbi:MAG: HD domain-containing protein [Clostridia bacterium]|nr:HD domain-containing protein [Clostridia bacterium]